MIRLPRAVATVATTVSLILLSACGGDGGGGGGTDPDPTDAIQSVTVSPATDQVALGGTLQLTATVRNGRNEVVNATVTWTSSDDGVATVDADGLVTAVAPGSVTVTASAGGRSGTAGVEAFDPNPPAAPGGVEATPVSNTEIDVTWTDNSSSETGHLILREEAGAAPSPGSGAMSSVFVEAGSVGPDVTSFRDAGLTPGTIYRYQVQACNSAGCSDPSGAGSEPATFPTLTIDTPDPLPSGQVGTAYQVDLQSSGPPATWSHVDGTLPAGLSLSGQGTLSGTPTEGGLFTPTVMAQGGGQIVTEALGLAIITPPAVATSGLPDGIRGAAYSATLEATGGDGNYAWTLTAGSLPAGLSLAGDGSLSGTPTSAGVANFTVGVTSAGLQASAQLSLRVLEPLEITTTALSAAVLNTAYSRSLAATGGATPYGWSLVSGSLPDGLTLAADGTISGTPTTLGTSAFRVGVGSSDGQTAEADLSIVVTSGAPVITTTSLPGGLVGSAYGETIQVTGGDGSYSWTVSAGALPGGLSLGPTDGVISGTPSAVGTFDFTVQVTSAGQSDTQDLSIVVTAPPVGFARSYLPGGYIGVGYAGTPDPATGGAGPLTYSITAGSLPAGLSLDASNGQITGTPSGAGMAFFEMTASDGSTSASVVFGLTISTAAPGGFNLFGVNVANSIPSADVQTAINAALAKIEAAITGDAPGFAMPGSGLDAFCNGNGGIFHGETVDDVEVLIDIGPIDGPGNIAGQGGICLGFTSPAPTVVAQLTLDSADLGPLPASLKLALVLHEMLHGMGFADGIFTALSLSTGSGGATPEYVGSGGVADFQTNLGGSGNPPLEETGGAGTAYSHWDEAFFDTELMTGFLDGSGNPFSSMTIAVLGDLGWPAIDPGAADSYSIPGCSPACTPPAGAPGVAGDVKIPLIDDVITGPVGILQPDGTVRVVHFGGR